MNPSHILGAALLGLLSLSTAVAHHSAAMFDPQKKVTLEGDVKAFQWTNPHCWIQLIVTSDGKPTEWSIEMGSPMQLYRLGWRPGSLKAGDRLRLILNPDRDGSPAGQFYSGQRVDGSPIAAKAQP